MGLYYAAHSSELRCDGVGGDRGLCGCGGDRRLRGGLAPKFERVVVVLGDPGGVGGVAAPVDAA